MDRNERREAYLAKLRDPRWQKKRLEILSRDNWTCRSCFDTEHTLHVHHLAYRKDTEPWEYPECWLVTLCETCHERETAEMRGASEELIFQLQRIGIFSDDIYTLAYSLYEGGVCEPPDLFCAALSWLFGTYDAQRMLVSAFLAAPMGKKGEA